MLSILCAAGSLYADCAAPCTYVDWVTWCRVTKTAPIDTPQATVQMTKIFDVKNPGIICPDSTPPAPLPDMHLVYHKETKTTDKYSLGGGAKWATFNLTGSASTEQTTCDTLEVDTHMIGYCQHRSADIAKTDTLRQCQTTEVCGWYSWPYNTTTSTYPESMHIYSIYYRAPAVPQDPDDPNCKTSCPQG